MGFLLGAYGKLMAGSRYRSLQSRMMRIQSQMRRASREVAEMEKSINRQVRDMTNYMRLITQNYSYGLQAQTQFDQQELFQKEFGKFYVDGKLKENMTDAEKEAYKTAQMDYTNQYTAIQQQAAMMNQQAQMMSSQQQQQIEQYKEYLEETQLQPLKDLEEDLQQEKDSLETQIQLAKADYDACKDMEKEGVKDLVPKYTGQG